MNQHRHLRSSEGLITRSFKSGNSVALRLPKELGFQAGEEVIITDHEDGTFSLRRAGDKVAALDALYGAFSSSFMAGGRGDIEQDERDWGDSPPDPVSN
ncbi:MAG: antitoxin [Sphingobium sp.]